MTRSTFTEPEVAAVGLSLDEAKVLLPTCNQLRS